MDPRGDELAEVRRGEHRKGKAGSVGRAEDGGWGAAEGDGWYRAVVAWVGVETHKNRQRRRRRRKVRGWG